ncbi:hypothetical protein EQM13_03095 [Acidilutibacter cellobiosedens]|uniref:Lactocepin n=1 Tax=Acidilutibacter cellobiosedens TaxID=2507161 RepID=A0A410Q9F0_9FIRM|nr:S8 family serine peptidase [Acidilutibacter cellobiosedens]QAT60632.1 hypothetical protein EQM13_03095 [Acidilutibacter cellobiosedens]
MKNIKKILSILLVFVMVVPAFAFAENEIQSQDVVSSEETVVESDKKVPAEMYKAGIDKDKKVEETGEKSDKDVRVIVEIEDDPAVVRATDKGKRFEEMGEKEKKEIEKSIISSQDKVIKAIEDKIDFEDKDAAKKEMPRFTTAFNGFAGFVKESDIKSIKETPGVKNVYISQEYERPQPDMNNSGGMVKAGETWDLGYKGEGTVIAIIDTGVDPRHHDMVLSDETTPKLDEGTVEGLISDNGLKGRYFTEKVPYGYNYYDENDEILDLGPGASQHGMHVAGTAGANGDPENGGIKGIAPESQLLAMKVFSNDPSYATTYDDIYLEAIDEAIKLGADVLNMSLGSAASFYVPESAVDSAITNAVNNGVVCSISAGNAGYISYGYDNPIKSNPDIGVVGAPSLSKDSISVASVENLKMTAPYLFYETEGEGNESLPTDSVIVKVYGVAYDKGYLEKNAEAQKTVVRVRKGETDREVYYKEIVNGEIKLYTMEGDPVDIDKYQGPTEVKYYGPGSNGDSMNVLKDNQGDYTEKESQKANAVQTSENSIVKIAMMVAGNINPVDVFGDNKVEYVDCGFGLPEDFEGKDLEGKVALVIRGQNPFTEKITNAQNAGSAGIIVYNHETGGEDLVNMATPANQTIPAVFIGNRGGTALAGLADKRIQFTNEVMSVSNPVGGQMSDFTSWGTTPTLEIKPEITAPGGQIYSTLQDNKYGTMSGTSMAAPHVSGGSALVRQYISENYEGLSLGEQTRLAKVLLMNTAEPLIDEYDAVYSPRRQGAGLMNLYGAVSTPVAVTDASTNEAKVELKDFDSENFSMTLRATNLSDDEVTYRVDTSVLTDEILNYQGTEYNLLGTVEMDAVVDAPGTVTVPANGSTEFTINVDFSGDENAYRNMFVEGFVTLTEVTDTHPTLSVPYVGFYGDWTEPSIIDGFEDLGEIPFYGMSGMVDTETYFMVPGKAAISPGTEMGEMNGTDTVTPVISFLRNAEKVEYNILKENGTKLTTIKSENFVRKTYIDGGVNPEYSFSLDRIWNGIARGGIVGDGLYYYQIKSKLQNTDEWQEKNIPVYVDTAAPVIKEISYSETTGNIRFKVEDATSGFRGYTVWIDGQQAVEFTPVEEGQDAYECPIGELIRGKNNPLVQIVAFDYALNGAIGSIALDHQTPEIYITYPALLNVYKNSEITVTGAVFNVTNPTVTLNGEEADEVRWNENVVVTNPDTGEIEKTGPGYEYSKAMTFEDGYNSVQVEAVSSGGGRLSISRYFYVDTNPPELNVTIEDRDPSSDTVNLTINMADNFPYLRLLVWGSEEFYRNGMEDLADNVVPINETTTVAIEGLEVGDNVIPIELTDYAGHVTEQTITITRTEEGTEGEAVSDVKGVIDLINKIPEAGKITLEDKATVESARSAYNALSTEDQKLVENINVLINAESIIEKLEAPEAELPSEPELP